MANTIETLLTGSDQLSPVLKKAEGNWQSMVKQFAAGNLIAQAAVKGLYMLKQAVYDLPKEVTMLNARVEEMNAVLGVVGKTAGYSQSSIKALIADVKVMGITTTEAQSAVVKMIQANLDLSKSTALARAAQDAAVIAQIDSSEALQRMIHGITTLQPEILRNMGLIVNLDAEYKKYATSVGKTAENLSANEKQQVAMNAVLEASTKITGAYEAAMSTAGKQLRSLPRYIQEAWESLGSVTGPVLKEIVGGATSFFKNLKKTLDENSAALNQIGKSITIVISKGVQFVAIILNITKTIIQWSLANQELIKGLVTLAATVTVAFKWGAITAGVLALKTAISLLPTVLGLAALAAKEFMVAIGPVGWIILGLGTAYTAYTAWLNRSNKELIKQEQELAKWQKSMQSSADVVQTLNSDLKRYGDLLQYALQYRAARATGTIDEETYQREMDSLRQEILLRDAAAAKAKQLAEEKKVESEKEKARREKLGEEFHEDQMGQVEAAKVYLSAMEEATAIGLEKELLVVKNWVESRKKELEKVKLDTALYNQEMDKVLAAAAEMEGEKFHEWQMQQIEDAKKTLEEKTSYNEAALAAYQEMYSGLKEFGIDDLEFTKMLIEKKKQEFIRATNDNITAEKWAAAETQKAWEENALLTGTFLQGIQVHFARVARELYTAAKAGADMAKIVGDSFEEMFSDLFNNKLKTFADYWNAFWQQMASVAAKLVRQELSDAISSLLGKTTSEKGTNILGDVLKAAAGAVGSWLGIGATTGNASIFSENIGLATEGWSGLKFASGGLVTKPTLGLIGESGPEAVIPLEKMGSNQNINIFHIVANDAASFMDMCRRNPGGIMQVFGENLKEYGSARRNILSAIG